MLNNHLFVSESFTISKLHKDTAMLITHMVAEGRGEEDILHVEFSWKPIYLDVCVYGVVCKYPRCKNVMKWPTD